MPQLSLRTQRLSSTSGSRTYFSILASGDGGAGGPRRIAKWTASQCKNGTGPCYYQQIQALGLTSVGGNGSSFAYLNNSTGSGRNFNIKYT
jgi:hypothetical protein